MPLITCPECGKQISDKSEFCVGCGCPASAFASLSVSSEVEICVEDGVLRYVDDPDEELTGTFTIPDGVTFIDRGALAETKITGVVIPEGVKIIAADAFAYTQIEELVLPKSLEDVRFGAFAGMKKLKKVKFLGLPKKWDSDIFSIDPYDDDNETLPAILSVELPEGLTEIPENLFMNAITLSSVVIPKSVKSIGNGAFTECRGLKSIQLHEGIEDIGALAFSECKALTSVALPKTLKRIGPGAFENCDKLTRVSFKTDDWAARACEDCPVDFNFENAEYGEIIGMSADECANAELMASYLVHNFVEHEFERGLVVQESAAQGAQVCELESYDPTEFLIENKVLKKYIGTKKTIYVPRGVVRIESFAFAGVVAGSISLPNTVVSIGDHAFCGVSSSSIDISEGVCSIGEEAFARATNLTSLRIPTTATFIGRGAFASCTKLRELIFAKSSGWYYADMRMSEKATAIPAAKFTEATKNPAAFLGAYGTYYLEKRK